MSEEDYKDIGAIKNKWIETKDDYLDMALNIIDKLQQENTQLKKCNNELSDLAILRFNELDKATIKLENAESVLKEIREYIKSHFKEMVAEEEAQGLLEIIDKGIGEDK